MIGQAPESRSAMTSSQSATAPAGTWSVPALSLVPARCSVSRPTPVPVVLLRPREGVASRGGDWRGGTRAAFFGSPRPAPAAPTVMGATVMGTRAPGADAAPGLRRSG